MPTGDHRDRTAHCACRDRPQPLSPSLGQLLVVCVGASAIGVTRDLDDRLVELVDHEPTEFSTSKNPAFKSALLVANVMLPGMFNVMLSPSA